MRGARPTKSGIDFFPLDTNIDEKLELIEAEFGIKGFGVVVRLFQWIYGRAGYYIEWTKEVALLFSHKIGEGESVVSEIVRASTQRGIFDREIYEKYGILTSRGIQKRYFEIVKRRKNFEINGDILLVDAAIFSNDVRIKRKNANISSENADISTQSKVKESKVKEEKNNTRAREEAWRQLIPTLGEVKAYASETQSAADPISFYNYYAAADWHDRNGDPVRNWRQKFAVWNHTGSGYAPARGNGKKSLTFYDVAERNKRHDG